MNVDENDERREALAWSQAKGIDPGVYAAAKVLTFRADNRLLSEDAFDAAIAEALGLRFT